MDLSTELSLLGIFITVLCFFIKTYSNSNNKNTNNSNYRNVSDSFNKTKLKMTQDNRTIINEHHHHTNNYVSPPQPPPQAPPRQPQTTNQQQNEVFNMLGLGIISVVAFGFALFYYTHYKELILAILSGVAFLGLIVSILVVYFKKYLTTGFKSFLLLYWVGIFGLIILSSHPIFPPKNIATVLDLFQRSNISDAISIFWNSIKSDNQNEVTFLLLQMLGLVAIIGYVLTFSLLIYNIMKNKWLRPLKNHITGYLVFSLFLFLFISGLFSKFIFAMQEISK